MKYQYSQYQKFLQKLALTPQMRQSIKILGMSTTDLHDFVDTALETNPFLKKEFDKKEIEKFKKSSAASRRDNTLPEDYMAHMKHEPNPREAIIAQIRMMGLIGKDLEIAEYLIYEIDDNGYITVNLEEIAAEFLVEMGNIEKVLKVIQSLEPAGIGARDIKECLKLQLERSGKKGSLEYDIVSEFSSELAQNNIVKIAKAMKKTSKDIRDAVKNIIKLNPRPASSILAEKTKNIIPDLIAKVSKERVILKLNKGWLPHLEFYNPYEGEEDIAKDEEAKEFIKDSMESAKRLIDGLQKRESTIYKVADYILQIQKHSFTEDAQDIKSLAAKDIASALNLHASTISRTISNKYIQINNKVVSIKSLLSKPMRTTSGDITSQTAIKEKVKKLINDEDKKKPLSDEAIRKSLVEKDIAINRRTVAKYRSSLRILPVYLRKKL
ncbi:MAG: RNA polymerase factor sigma-54, partial [Candidatus Omnitrophota bacterium]